MKDLRFIALVLSLIFLHAESIEFGNHTIFYGIGQDAFSGYWAISQTGNTFSGQDIGDFGTGTQLWIVHHALTVYLNEGDSLIAYDYNYRYYRQDEAPCEWLALSPVMGEEQQHSSGYWYICGYLDHTGLFSLPLDTGDYFLEFEHAATVVDSLGDTVRQTMVLPDSAEFKAEFTVIPSEQDGSEGSSPVVLSSFTATVVKGKVLLDWITASETENSHFLIYRDGEVIAQIDGAGTTSETHSYSYTDTPLRQGYAGQARVQAGVHRYAISDVTYGGIEKIHDAVTVEVRAALAEASFKLNKAYPNPFNPRVTLSMELSFAQGYGESGYGAGANVVLNIYNSQGVLVDQLMNGYVSAGHHEVIWDASDMPSGIYMVKLQVGEMMQTQKIVLMK